MSGAIVIILAAASFGATVAAQQNSTPAQPSPSTPPPALLGQPTPTSPVPSAADSSSGATINAATGQPVTNSAGALISTNAAGAVPKRSDVRSTTPLPGVAAAAARKSNITPIQLQNINRLAIDLNGLGLPSRDASDQLRSLTENLQAAPIASVRPSQNSITKLGATLAAVVPGLNLTASQRRQLAIDLNLALNSGNLSAIEVQRVMTDARGLLQRSAAMNPKGVQELLNAMAGIMSDVQTSMAQSASPPATGVPPSELAEPGSNSTVPNEVGQGGDSQSGQGSGSSTPQAPPEG